MSVEKLEKPPAASEKKTIGNEEFAEWLGRNYQIKMSVAIHKTLGLSQEERKLMVEVKKRIPEITLAELEYLRNGNPERILANIKTFEDNEMNPHTYVRILNGNPSYMERNLKILAERKLKASGFRAILPRNPEFVKTELEMLDDRKIDPAKFEPRSIIGENPERFRKVLERTRKVRINFYSFADKEYCKVLISGEKGAESRLGSEEERRAFGEVWEELDRRGKKGEIGKNEIWDIFKKAYGKDLPSIDTDPVVYDPKINTLHNRMNSILLYLVKNGGLNEPEGKTVERKVYQ